jgi:Mrp family chromosome partitioning ATPase
MAASSPYGVFLRRHGWLVAALVLLGTLGGWGAQQLSGATYLSTASVLVTPTGTEPTELANERTTGTEVNLDTEAQLVTSAVVASVAATDLGENVDPSLLVRNVSVTVPPNTAVLRIGFESSDPQRAQQGAAAFADAYLANRTKAAQEDVDAEVAGLQSRATSLRERLAEIADGGPASATEQQVLLDQLAVINTSLDDTLVAQSDPGRIITPAELPEGPSGLPAMVFPFSGGLLGLLLGLGLGMLRDRQARTVREGHDLEMVGAAPLGEVLSTRGAAQLSVEGTHGRELRKLQARVRGMLGDRWVLVVAGASPGNAGGFLAANLAASLARSGADVLFVGANADAPAGAGLLGEPTGPGLVELLQHESRDAVDVHEVGPGSTLQVVHPGADSGMLSDLLHGQTLASQVAQWKSEHDYVVIEVAPAALDSDLEAVAPLADGVLLVAESGRTRPREIVDATERLAGVNAKLLGVTLLRSVRARRRGKGSQAGTRPPAANQPTEASATTRQSRNDAYDPHAQASPDVTRRARRGRGSAQPAASPGGAR